MVHVYCNFIYMFIHNLFLFCKAHFRVYLSYILSCILTVGILIIILLLLFKYQEKCAINTTVKCCFATRFYEG